MLNLVLWYAEDEEQGRIYVRLGMWKTFGLLYFLA